jgi:hypothetical protein
MRFDVILENNSVDKKDLFLQKVIKVDANDRRDAVSKAYLEAQKQGIGKEWKPLYAKPAY